LMQPALHQSTGKRAMLAMPKSAGKARFVRGIPG